jgi:hypothetical protein
MLFAATGLGERSIRRLKNSTGKKLAIHRKAAEKAGLSCDDTPVNSRIVTINLDRMSVDTPKDVHCDQPPRDVEPAGDACPLAHKPSTVPSCSSQREEHQFQLILNEDNA